MRESELRIGTQAIGGGGPPFIVAEISANHLQDLGRAKELVHAASEAGASAVKLQTYDPDSITLNVDGSEFRIESGPWAGKTLHQLYREAYTPWEWHEELFALADAIGITIFSSPFDDDAVRLLESLGCPAYKIASFELIDTGLIATAAATGKPLLISTGMANEAEISDALGCVPEGRTVLLHAVSAYPTSEADANLLRMEGLEDAFGTPVGLSDHSPGSFIASCAVALGASVVEKHLTIRRDDGGPDAVFSLEPEEFQGLVDNCQRAWSARGRKDLIPSDAERNNIHLRRSLYAVEDIKEGDEFTRFNIRSIRPGLGLPPKHLSDLLGKRATKAIRRGTPLDWDAVT